MTPLAVIIVGAPRSGTYWVVDLLQARFNIKFPSETHFIPLFAKYLWLWGDLSIAQNRRRLLLNVYEFLQIWTARSSSSSDYLAQIRRLSLLATLDEGRANSIIENSVDYPSLVRALFQHFADIHGVDASGDKSAYYRARSPEQTFGLFPESLMLHVIRDGRDVALSWTKQWFGPRTLRDAAQLWRDHVDINRQWGNENPTRYLEIRYEDLATNREAEIHRLELFLGRTALPEDHGRPQSALAKALSATQSHSAMLEIVAEENVSKWSSAMPANDADLFERIAARALSESGYAVASGLGAGVRDTLPRFSLHEVRVAAKSILPLILLICTRVRIPLLALVNRRYPIMWQRVSILNEPEPGNRAG